MSTINIVQGLVERFDQYHQEYRSGIYNETKLRREFLDPFFECLGWDVSNKKGQSEVYKEVIHEDRVKTEQADEAAKEALKAPDYAFRIGGTRKFFVEAKKPSINIGKDINPAFQLRCYAWSAKLPVSILTDFEEFAIYDCRVKPDKGDKADKALLDYFRYNDYVGKWEGISNWFSYDAVQNGSFDQYIEKSKTKKGWVEVDNAFLIEIEHWREELAKNIAERNEQISIRALNYAVQMTIDRIIFLRICEDRGIEPYEQLQLIASSRDIYENLGQLFQRADARYNSGLFHFGKEKNQSTSSDSLTLGLKIDDQVLKNILNNLYYPESPYVFSVIPADILGQVYERFLGKVIRLNSSHEAIIEDKPEVRKAGGVYYTPTYIVDYIVRNTVGKLLEGKTPKDAAKLKILDPACGSGHFALGSYQYLLDWHLDWYTTHEPKKWTVGKNPTIFESRYGWRLTTAKKKEILLNNIFGVDIDPQAVEMTKLSLLLKVLEGENQETIGSQLALWHERVLPDLGNNIQCGNSLIGHDYYEERQSTMLIDNEERWRVNSFDWIGAFPQVFNHGGFDVVIGNPPYGTVNDEKLLQYLNAHYKHQDYQKDYYLLFLERYNTLLKKDGVLGVIISNTWLQSVNLRNIRQYLTNFYSWEKILHTTEKVFNAVVDTHVLIFRKCEHGVQDDDHVSVDFMKDKTANQHHILVGKFIPKNGDTINIVANQADYALSRKIALDSARLETLFSVYNGIKPFEVGKGKPPQTQKIAKEQPYVIEGLAPDKTWKPLLRGGLINRYKNNWNNNYWVLYGEWLAAPRDPAIFDAPKKIMVRQTGDSIIATIIESGYVARNNMHIILAKNTSYQFEYLLGLMNSKLMDFAYRFINPEKGEALAEIKKKHVEQLPIHIINFSDLADKARHDKIVLLVKRLLDLHRLTPFTPPEEEMLKREIQALDRSIDCLVYELYGLTDDEIRIVESQ